MQCSVSLFFKGFLLLGRKQLFLFPENTRFYSLKCIKRELPGLHPCLRGSLVCRTHCMAEVKGESSTRKSPRSRPPALWHASSRSRCSSRSRSSSSRLLARMSRGSRVVCGKRAGSAREPARGWWEPGDAPPAAPALPGALSAMGAARRQPPASGWGGQEGMLSSSPNREKTFVSLLHPSQTAAGGPAAETPIGSSSLLGVPSSVGRLSFCISYASVYFFSLVLETRRMLLPLPPSYITIKLPSRAQWWQEMTNVTLPPVHYELLCIPVPEKASCPFLNLGYN